ncbi:MAG: maleylpyruvate isomerase family mycothiol-dependent enzyme [Actinoallomurus sp.]
MNDHERRLIAAEAEIERFIEVTGEADLTAPVPACPGWTVADLVRHVGNVHRWMTRIVLDRPAERPPASGEGPGTPDGYRDWLAAGVAPLVSALRETDGDTPCWAIGPDQHVRSWPLRLRYEMLIHRADLELALGRTPVITAETAAEGVEEFLTNLLSRERVATRLREFGHAGETVHLHATDGEGEWTVTLGAETPGWERGHAKGTAAVRGTTGDLLLLLWGRYAPDERFAVFGDGDLLSGWLAAAST